MSEIDKTLWKNAIEETTNETDFAALDYDTIKVLRDFLPRLAERLGLSPDYDALDDLEDYLNEPVVYKPSPEIKAFQENMTLLEPLQKEFARVQRSSPDRILVFHDKDDGSGPRYQIASIPGGVLAASNDLNGIVEWLKSQP